MSSNKSFEEEVKEQVAKLTGESLSPEAVAAAVKAAKEAAAQAAGKPPEGEPKESIAPLGVSQLGAIAAAEGAKAVAITQVRSMRLKAGKDCPGADCAFACAVGCLVGCGIFGGTTVAFGSLGGVVGGSGTAIAMTRGLDVKTVEQLPLAQYITGGGECK